MKLRFFLSIVVLTTMAALTAQNIAIIDTAEQTGMVLQCYCSDICAPRLPNKSGDKPFESTKYKDANDNPICFCQQRDEDNYEKHECNTRSVQIDFENSCGKKQIFKKPAASQLPPFELLPLENR